MKDASRKTVNRQFDTADAAIAAQLSILRPLLLPAGKLSSMRSLQRTI
jgi:hypothetical protein